jgi:hypothetical protein
MSTVIMMTVLTTVLSLSSCKKESEPQTPDKITDQTALNSSERNGAPLKVDGLQAYLRVRNSAGQMVNAATTGNPLLFTRTTPPAPALSVLTPLLAPDGHQLTLAEFRMVSGWVDVKCINKGTHAVFHMKGLIPNGVYTLWIFAFRAPGPPNFMAAGPFGAPDGSNNSFLADAEGTASVSIKLGDLAYLGSSGNCLSSIFESHIVTAYHPDQQTHGAMPGSIWVGQLFFPVLGSQL